MKNRFFVIIIILLLIPAAVWAGKGRKRGPTGSMNVQMRKVIVRAAPSYLSGNVGTLTYGTKVNVVGKEGNWCQIDSPSGWLPKNTLTKMNVKVNPDQSFAKGGASRDEVALAGQGFNPQVEAKYRKDNPQLASAFASVNRVETFGATEAELKNFRRTGQLQ